MLAELAGVLQMRSRWRRAQLKSGQLSLGQAVWQSSLLAVIVKLLQQDQSVSTESAQYHLTALTIPGIPALEHKLAGRETATDRCKS